ARPAASDVPSPHGDAIGGGRCRSEVFAEQIRAATDGGQKAKGLACFTCGSLATASATSAGTGPSTSINAMASWPGALRPSVKLAILILASPRSVPSLPIKP